MISKITAPIVLTTNKPLFWFLAVKSVGIKCENWDLNLSEVNFVHKLVFVDITSFSEANSLISGWYKNWLICWLNQVSTLMFWNLSFTLTL